MTDVNLKTVGANELVNARTGEVVSLESLWQGPQPVVITFLRRFGCAVCRWCARELSTGMARANLPAGAVRLVAVASERIGLQEFLDGNFFSGGDLFIDDKKQCYNDLGFKRYNALSIIPVALGKKVRDIVAKVGRRCCCASGRTRRVILSQWRRCWKFSVSNRRQKHKKMRHNRSARTSAPVNCRDIVLRRGVSLFAFTFPTCSHKCDSCRTEEKYRCCDTLANTNTSMVANCHESCM
ncbi:unnamed protein product [Lampetra fluviatilis]